MRLNALVFASLALLLSGCSGIEGDHTFTVPDDAKSSADVAGGDGYDLRVRVVDQNGTPQAGAAVVYFHIGGGGSGQTQVSGEAGTAGASGTVFWSWDVESYDMVAGLRTDADGWAVADLEPGGSIHVAAGDVDGLTTEVERGVAVGAGGDVGTLTLVLYPETVTFTRTLSVDAIVGRTPIMAGQYQSFAFPLSDDASLAVAYQERILELDAAMTWSNGAAGLADFYVGLSGDPAGPTWEGQDREQVTPGTHTETLMVQEDALDGKRQELAKRGLHVHAMTDWVSLTYSGIDVETTVTAELKGSNIRIN